MRILAIDCATEACSAALFEGSKCLDNFHEIIGRGHAETLVPAIKQFPDKGRADRILVSIGPGSFTGVRIGIAVARALGLAWQAEVLGYPTLALVATVARAQHPGPVTVSMAGGHGEWFVQNFGPDGLPQDTVQSLTPEHAATACRHQIVAGNKSAELVEQTANGRLAVGILPDARHALALPQTLLTPGLSPNYGRAPDAILPKARPQGAKK